MRRRHRRPKNWVSPCERRLDQRADVARRASDRDAAGEISPDGRWLAYHSNESGRNEVYVRPFPNVDGGRWQISTGGGTRPLWARSGRELFYLDDNGLLTSVAVQTTPGFNAANPTRVLNTRYFAGWPGLCRKAASGDFSAITRAMFPGWVVRCMISSNLPFRSWSAWRCPFLSPAARLAGNRSLTWPSTPQAGL